MTKDSLSKFEWIARQAAHFSIPAVVETEDSTSGEHPFDTRCIHPELWKHSKKLFDDGHYCQATFEAFKYLEKKIKKLARGRKTGYTLMMEAFKPDSPKVRVADTTDVSGRDEQQGFQFLFAGGVMAIRNPRGHEVEVADTLEACLDHLSFASMLLRKIDDRYEP